MGYTSLFLSSLTNKMFFRLSHSLYSSCVHICTSLQSFLHFFEMTLPITLLKKRVASLLSVSSQCASFVSPATFHHCHYIFSRSLYYSKFFSLLLCLHFPQLWLLAFLLLIFFFNLGTWFKEVF